MKELDNSTFENTISSSQPVLVDFWAEWCMPCRMFAPVLEELSNEMDGKADICKLNIDANGELASRYGVSSIPTLILFQNGQEKERMVGVNPKENVEKLIQKYL